MCTIYHYFGADLRLKDSLKSSEGEKVEVSEVWESPGHPDSIVSIHKTISKTDLELWFSQTNGEECLDRFMRCISRVVWVTVSAKQGSCDTDFDILDNILQKLGLETAQEHSSHCYSWSTCSSSHDQAQRANYFGKHPRVSLTWTYNEYLGTTSAVCIAENSKIKILRSLLDYKFTRDLVPSELFWWFLSALMLSKSIDDAQEKIKCHVREVEVRTGYHNWKSRREDAAIGDLNSLSAKMSGCETKTASLNRRIEVAVDLTNFLLQKLSMITITDENEEKRHQNLKIFLEALLQRAKMQRFDADFFSQRIKSQLTALFHLITQNDSLVSQEIAKDSRFLALAAQRDSSSMKSLAIVTMFFLPGTFVSSLFSIPLFDWDSTDPTIMYRQSYWLPRLGIYAAVTVPLMLFTFSIWAMWLYIQSVQNRKRREEALHHLNQDLKTTEVGALANRRSSAYSL